jgi:hypothetical protein
MKTWQKIGLWLLFFIGLYLLLKAIKILDGIEIAW